MYGPAMDLNQVPDNGQTKAKAAMRARGRHVGLPKAFEYVRQEVRTDPLAVVCHHNLNARINPPQANLDAAPFGSELDRIGEQVPYHLLQSFRISGHRPGEGLEVSHKVNVFRFCRGTHYIQGGVDDLRRLDVAPIQPQLAGYNAGYIEEIIDELPLGTCLSPDGLKRTQLGSRSHVAFQQQ